jgi:hypothetical protein
MEHGFIIKGISALPEKMNLLKFGNRQAMIRTRTEME